MVIGLAIKFIGGRYHATPWGRHPNEGLAEWPISPWRILRTIIAIWKRKLDGKLNCLNEEEAMKAILQKLSNPPSYYLPPAFSGSCRYYMRWYKKGPEDKTKIFDNFMVINKEECLVALWEDVEFNNEELRILSMIVSNINYLGRSESLCEAGLLDQKRAQEYIGKINCFLSNGEVNKSNYDIVNVLSPNAEEAFLPRIINKGLAINEPNWNICIETLDLHKEKWAYPPGAKVIQYLLHKDCLKGVYQRKLIKKEREFHIVRYALDSNVLPLLQETLTIAEFARSAIMGIYGRLFANEDGSKAKSRIFSGKDEDGNKLEGHIHAHYLPTDEDGDGKLDHLNIFVPGGFSGKELKALFNFRLIKRPESYDLRLVLLSVGEIDEFNRFIFAEDEEWISATPFISVRFPKRNGTKRDPIEILNSKKAFLNQVLKEELCRLSQRKKDFPDVSEIEIIPMCDENDVFRLSFFPYLRPIQYKRFRMRRKDSRSIRHSGFFRLKFLKPVKGPICLGHLSHFGMGLFIPASVKKI